MKHEIDDTGTALNDAGWAFINACTSLGVKLDGDQWNSCKQGIVKPVIEAYLESTNLDTGKTKPMSEDILERELRHEFQEKFGTTSQPTTEWQDLLLKMAKRVQKFTVQQGFVVDWSKAPKTANGVLIAWSHWDNEEQLRDESAIASQLISYIPRPAPEMRKRTREEKIGLLMGHIRFGSGVSEKSGELKKSIQDATIDDLCQAAGISLETEVGE